MGIRIHFSPMWQESGTFYAIDRPHYFLFLELLYYFILFFFFLFFLLLLLLLLNFIIYSSIHSFIHHARLYFLIFHSTLQWERDIYGIIIYSYCSRVIFFHNFKKSKLASFYFFYLKSHLNKLAQCLFSQKIDIATWQL